MTREEAIRNLIILREIATLKETKECADLAIDALKQPEIIRCKDCQFFAISRQGKSWCKSSTRHIKPEDFCSRGWRREECQPKDDASHPFADDVLMGGD